MFPMNRPLMVTTIPCTPPPIRRSQARRADRGRLRLVACSHQAIHRRDQRLAEVRNFRVPAHLRRQHRRRVVAHRPRSAPTRTRFRRAAPAAHASTGSRRRRPASRRRPIPGSCSRRETQTSDVRCRTVRVAHRGTVRMSRRNSSHRPRNFSWLCVCAPSVISPSASSSSHCRVDIGRHPHFGPRARTGR